MNSIHVSKPARHNLGQRPKSVPSEPIHVPKLVGSDIEWSNTLEGIAGPDRCTPAGWLLLGQLGGLPREDIRALQDPRLPKGVVQWPDERDLGRRFTVNGGCDYMDSGHAETASPEMLSARQHTAWWIAKQRIVREATAKANSRLPTRQRLRVGIRNTDGFVSWGSHDNFTTTAIDLIFKHAPTTSWLASFQVSCVCLTGAGKIGSENQQPHCRYQISQRADHFTRLRSEETMFERPIINLRDEPHCGPHRQLPFGRYHMIMHDANLSPVAHFLKIGTMQIALVMVEAGEIDPRLCLADPVSAHVAFSHDPSLMVEAPMHVGGKTTIVELQARFFEAADRFVSAGKCNGLVSEADFIMRLWGETLSMLERRDFDKLVSRLDWVHRLTLIEAALAADSRLSWENPALRLIDFGYGDITEGAFFQSLEAGIVEQLVTEDEIQRGMSAAPEDTRAWSRSRLLFELLPPELVVHVDWDSITLGTGTPGGKMRTLWLSNPLGFTKADSPIRNATTFSEAITALEQAGAFASTT